MMDQDDVLERTVRYKTRDPIESLRVRVTLTQLSGHHHQQHQQHARCKAAAGADAPPPPQQQQQQQNGGSSVETGDTAAAAAAVSAPDQPPPPPLQRAAAAAVATTHTRVFAWQEKVYSRAELEAARRSLARHAGSSSGSGSDGGKGAVLFSYVSSDPYSAEADVGRAATTAPSEMRNALVARMRRDAWHRRKARGYVLLLGGGGV
jgi:hypothetical protein